MVRTTIIPKNTDVHLIIPLEYVGKPIEITYMALEELEGKPVQKTMADFFGTLDNETYQELKVHTEQARKEWDRNIY